MKLLFLLALFFSLHLSAQNISGLYSGTLHNDSAKQTQQYELGLSEYRGKITGYAYATFIANDTFYYSIRRVRATREGNQLVVEDEEMIANNFPRRPDKGVHRISYIPLANLKESDTLRNFAGNWKTTQTKKFYSAPGSMDMARESDSTQSALVAHLRELNILAPEGKMVGQHEENIQPPVAKKDLPKKETAPQPQTVIAAKPKPTSEAHGDLKKLEPVAKPAAPEVLSYTERKKPMPQIFNVASDSLQLSFYDNGVVDGDVISVYVNGENVISKTKLLEAATKRTIHLPAGTDSVELLLVAETLGSIPPNTGLLVVQDGTSRYEVRFSADLQTNAAIVFRKRN